MSIQSSAAEFEIRIKHEFELLGYEVEDNKRASDSPYDFKITRRFPFPEEMWVEIKYHENSLVPSSIVRRIKETISGGSRKIIIVTTVGFSIEAKIVAGEYYNKLLLQTEMDLIGQLPPEKRSQFFEKVLKSEYFKWYLSKNTGTDQWENPPKILQSDTLIKGVSEASSSTELANSLRSLISREELLKMLFPEADKKNIIDFLARMNDKNEELKQRKKQIKDQYDEVKILTDSYAKGKKFEKIVSEILSLDSNLKVVGTDINNDNEEIDVQVRNRGVEGIWKEFEGMIFVECKYWNKPIGAEVIRNFKGKLDHYKLHKGIIVSLNGHTGKSDFDGAVGEIRTIMPLGCLILILDSDDIEDILNCMSLSDKLDEKFIRLYQLGKKNKHDTT